MNDDFAFGPSEPMGQPDDKTSTVKKPWRKPEVILSEIDETKNSANTVSDGTGNLFS